MSRWIDQMVSKTKWVNWITIIITVAGLAALFLTKRDLHPPFEFNNITVTVLLPEASPGEMERLITYPIEEKLLKLSGLKQLKSSSEVGKTKINLSFRDDIKSLQEKTEEIRSKVQSVLSDLPAGISRVQVEPDTEEANQIFLANYALQGLDEKNQDHHLFVSEWKRRMMAIPGIARVETSLRPLRPYILFENKKLQSLHISPSTIRQAILSHYQFQPVSYYNNQGEEWLIEMDRQAIDPEQIRKIPLFSDGQGQGLKIGDLAKVEWRQ
ncbi:MAG: efflux RND transporter permease subunit, partial [Pseudobdellovibrionaceae bacterium]